MTATKAVFYDTCAITVIIEGGYRMSNKIIKSVSFNVTNSEDEIMLKAIKKRNFSGYVKKLIMADIEAKRMAKAVEAKMVSESEPFVVSKEVAESNFEKLKKRQQLAKQSSAPKVFKPN
jgi:hypothetical protein